MRQVNVSRIDKRETAVEYSGTKTLTKDEDSTLSNIFRVLETYYNNHFVNKVRLLT